MAAASVATLRSKVEFDLRGRVAAPFTYRDRNVFELVSSGIAEIDDCVGGLPRGAMTEVCGAAGSGRTSLLLAALAARTAAGEVCALVDARDSFDPATAEASGVALKQLLWARCRDVDQALRATDLLIQSGGFGMVAVDLSDVATKTVRQVPLNAWFRFRRAVEDTPTILLMLEQEPQAKTCASLVLRLEVRRACWAEAELHASEKSSSSAAKAERKGCLNVGPEGPTPKCKTAQERTFAANRYSLARLLQGFQARSEVVRSRIQTPAKASVVNIRDGKNAAAQASLFESKTRWSGLLDGK